MVLMKYRNRNVSVNGSLRKRRKMKRLTIPEANSLLAAINMQVGPWNQLEEVGDHCSAPGKRVHYQAPKDGNALLNFAQHITTWLPKGEWRILQIDNSTSLDAVQENQLGRILYGPNHLDGLCGDKTFLFEFGHSPQLDKNLELVISELVFTFLLFESHVYFASAGSKNGRYLGVQDGFVYLFGNERSMEDAGHLLKNFEQFPNKAPDWIMEIIVERENGQA